MRIVTPEDVPRVTHYEDLVVADYLGCHDSDASVDGFQAFLVEQRKPLIGAHFHEVDQFQIVVAGGGSIGRHPATKGMVHYTDGYTTYGPISTQGPNWLSYFTLRKAPTVGINYMPGARHALKAKRHLGEHFLCAVPVDGLDADASESLHQAGRQRAATARGAYTYAYNGPSQEFSGADAAGAGFAVVLQGTVKVQGQMLGFRSLVAFESCEELVGMSASKGAVVGIMIFPKVNEPRTVDSSSTL